MDRKRRVLIVDDDASIHLATKYILKAKYDCASAYNGDEAKAILTNQKFDLVLMDLHMRRHEEGLEFLPILKEVDADVDFVIVSSNTELDLASRAVRAGASAYLVKEHSAEQLIITIESVLSRRALLHENQHYVKAQKRTLEKNQVIGKSPAMLQLMRDIEKIRRTSANVIITAPTGCGKELIARHIGAAEGKPFVAVDSATITSTMAESLLFGHEKGAFTGAVTQQKGMFEEANGGTIYFDEIGNMPLDIQAKLLRVIQEKEVVRLGSSKVIPLEFRVICASNQDLEKLAAEGKFKEDLYQRLNVISLHIPALKDRREDLPLLLEHFFKHFGKENSPKRVSKEAMEILSTYAWPGNIRELSNLVANFCTLLSDQEEVQVQDLPARISMSGMAVVPVSQAGIAGVLSCSLSADQDFFDYMTHLEGKVLEDFYKRFGGNVSKMSKELRISRSHLYSKLYAHGIH